MKKSLVICTLFLSLWARENPFKPVIAPQESGKVAEIEPQKPFEKLEITLPSSSRKIKAVQITYQNIDGSTDSIEKRLDNDIDWHFPILISHKPQNTAPKEETKKEKDEGVIENRRLIEQNELLQTPSLKKIEVFDFISFAIDKSTLYIYAKDEKIRDFPLSEPTKVVIDLKRPVTFKSKTIDTKLPYFTEIAIGNHTESYRLAIKLDGLYKYTLERIEGGYKLSLK